MDFIAYVLIPTALLFPLYCITMVVFPQAIYDIKSSILLKRLRASSIKPWMLYLVSIIYYSMIALVSYFVGVSFAPMFMLYSDSAFKQLIIIYQQANWITIIYVCLVNVVLGSSFGFLLLTFARNASFIPMIGLSILLISLMCAGLIIPLPMIKIYSYPLWCLSYADPLRYAATLSYEAWFPEVSNFNIYGSSIWDFNLEYVTRILPNVGIQEVILTPADKIADFFVPYFFSIVCIGVSFKFFKFK